MPACRRRCNARQAQHTYALRRMPPTMQTQRIRPGRTAFTVLLFRPQAGARPSYQVTIQDVRRRRFITLLGGAAVCPLAVRAQQRERMRRIGVLMNLSPGDQEGQSRIAGFLQGLQERGWAVGGNVRIDYRWGGNDAALYRKGAEELIALAPDILMASGTAALGALHSLTRTVPIVFANVIDPVGGGFVASLAQPKGNATGFTVFEYSIAGKWLERLKQIAPSLRYAAVLRDPSSPYASGQFGVIQALAPSLGVELVPVDSREAEEIERAITAFAQKPNGGLLITASAIGLQRKLIIELAARYRLPAIYPFAFYAGDGGLLAYGPNSIDQYRRAAGYVDRILKGEKPADLPVQAPVKYDLVINLRTARALGLDVPAVLLATADEVIE
jgi:putative tryptophan/tyrosine transport system substrate-binding protein